MSGYLHFSRAPIAQWAQSILLVLLPLRRTSDAPVSATSIAVFAFVLSGQSMKPATVHPTFQQRHYL